MKIVAMLSKKKDSSGIYIFNQDNVTGGLVPYTQYVICVDETQFTNKKGVEGSVLEGMALTISDVENNSKDNIDSDTINNENGSTAYIIFTTEDFGANDHSFDLGFVTVVSIGDRIWLDSNSNGIQDDGESDFNESVTVTLLDENGNSVVDAQGNTVSSITTTNGIYKFENLLPGTYKVKFDIPTGYSVAPKGTSGDDATDSDADPSTLTTDAKDVQDDNVNFDLGIYQKASIGDYVWDDTDKDGIQDEGETGVSGVTVRLLDENGNEIDSTQTDVW